MKIVSYNEQHVGLTCLKRCVINLMTHRVVNAIVLTSVKPIKILSGGRKMATKAKPVEQNDEQETSPMYEGLRKLVVASIGAVAIAQEELENLISKLVERGELAEKEGKKNRS